jgi:hypothetical protein
VFTEPVAVTSGPSHFKKGRFEINENETLASFFAAVNPSPVEIELTDKKGVAFPDTLKVSSGKSHSFEMSFMRTVRVPDDGKVHNLPPGSGRFPLFNIASFADRVPEEMLSKGGVFLPIYRRRSPLEPNY